MTHAGVARYFSNKHELVVAALQHRDAVDIDSRLPHFPEAGHGTSATFRVIPRTLDEAREVIQALIDILELNESRPGLVSLFVKTTAEGTAPEHAAHQIFALRYANLRVALSAAFDIALRHQGLHADPQMMAVQALALADGAQIQWLLDQTSTTPAQPLRAFLEAAGILPLAQAEHGDAAS